MSNQINFNISVINWVFDELDEQPTGVLVQVDNGDTQYLTINEYNKISNKNNECVNRD
jgi:hypothetical protein